MDGFVCVHVPLRRVVKEKRPLWEFHTVIYRLQSIVSSLEGLLLSSSVYDRPREGSALVGIIETTLRFLENRGYEKSNNPGKSVRETVEDLCRNVYVCCLDGIDTYERRLSLNLEESRKYLKKLRVPSDETREIEEICEKYRSTASEYKEIMTGLVQELSEAASRYEESSNQEEISNLLRNLEEMKKFLLERATGTSEVDSVVLSLQKVVQRVCASAARKAEEAVRGFRDEEKP